MTRRQNFQTISWFWDLHTRRMLNLDPPYQRRSVWSQGYKDSFIETILRNLPAPALFLYEQIEPSGRTTYHVVDGKQRLTAIFEFVDNKFPAPDTEALGPASGRYFKDLDIKTKSEFWGYQFSIEYLPSSEATIIDEIFNRLNRNVARLSRQELRHAQFSGLFMRDAEDLSEWLVKRLPQGFPRIADQSRRQMKDVELVVHLLLLLERILQGQEPQSHGQDDLDRACMERDESWEQRDEVQQLFRQTVDAIKEMVDSPNGMQGIRSRLQNQVDFYSLFGAIAKHIHHKGQWEPDPIAKRLLEFARVVDDDTLRPTDADAQKYYEAARSASSDPGPRKTRMDALYKIICEHP